MAAALWNYSLNRRQSAHLRREEALSVAAALYGEILLLRKEVARLARAVASVDVDIGTSRDPVVKLDAHFAQAHTLSEPLLYKQLASKIGMLSPDLIIAITEFHQNLQEVRTWLPLLIERDDRKYDYGTSSVLIPARDAVRNVLTALRQIERRASVPKPAGDLDLGHTDYVIEREEEISSMAEHSP